MKKLFLLVIFVSSAFAQVGDVGGKGDSDTKDIEALRRWIQDKRLVTMKEIGGDLSLSGEVRTEFQASSEKRDGVEQRGTGPAAKAMYAWDVEFNLMLDYRSERSWAAIKLEFDNDMGLRTGTTNKIALEKAYLGGRLIAGDTFTWDAELGRRYLTTVYTSKVEFGALYDGIRFLFSKAFPSIGDYFVNAGAFIVNDKTNHYGLIAEIGALRVANVGVNLKYSMIDWTKPGGEAESGNTSVETELTNLRFRFLVSQFLAEYQFFPQWFNKKLIKFYGAGLVNHIALKDPLARAGIHGQAFGKQNWAWYAGVALGTLKKQYDWTIDANVQWVQAQAIPTYDISGIGRGIGGDNNPGLYTVRNDGTGGATTKATAAGNANYYGFAVNGLYLLTDNLTLNPIVYVSWTLDKNLGPNIIYKQCELEFIYAF